MGCRPPTRRTSDAAGDRPTRAPIGNRTLDLFLTMETLCRQSYWGAADTEKRCENAFRTTCCATVRLHGRRRGYEIEQMTGGGPPNWEDQGMSGLLDGQHDTGPTTEPPDPPVGFGDGPRGTDVGDVDTRLVDV